MHNLFGTDGIREKVRTFPVTSEDFIRLGKAIAAFATQTQSNPTFVIGYDTRISSSFLASCIETGLLHYTIELTSVDVCTTPLLFLTTQESFDYGIMVTASHNTYDYNGVKIFKKNDGKLSLKDELAISELFYKNDFLTSYAGIKEIDYAANPYDNYFEAIDKKKSLSDIFDDIALVIDGANGAICRETLTFLENFDIDVTEINTDPDGKNINKHCGVLHPEALQKTVLAEKADIGVAFDGDGDRLCIVSKDGIIKDGDDILAFLLTHHPVYKKSQAVVGTVMSNQGLQKYVESLGKKFYRTPVGDKNVIQKMNECGALIGAEPSGHVILKDFLPTSDAFFTFIQLVRTAQLIGDFTFPSFTKFPHTLVNVPVAAKKDLSLSPFVDIIQQHEKALGAGRLVVRYSGTEPLLRIMVEAETQAQSDMISQTLSLQLTNALL